MSSKPVKRRYESPARRAAAEATREAICAAAEELFLRDGYARTSIKAVARAAGVAEATVYLAFPNKAALLDATILRAIRASGSEALSQVLEAEPPELLARLAAATAAVLHHAARLMAIGDSAAVMDAELRPRRDRAYAGVRAAMLAIAERLDAAGLLRPGLTPQAAADTLFAISSDSTYLRLVEDCGMAPEDYAAWLTATTRAVLLAG